MVETKVDKKHWTVEEDKVIRRRYPKGGSRRVSLLLNGRSRLAIRRRAIALDVKTKVRGPRLSWFRRKGSEVFLTMKGAVQYCQVSRQTIYEWCRSGLPYKQDGRHKLFAPEDLQKRLNRSRRKVGGVQFQVNLFRNS